MEEDKSFDMKFLEFNNDPKIADYFYNLVSDKYCSSIPILDVEHLTRLPVEEKISYLKPMEIPKEYYINYGFTD
jgi:hypothetical protein